MAYLYENVHLLHHVDTIALHNATCFSTQSISSTHALALLAKEAIAGNNYQALVFAMSKRVKGDPSQFDHVTQLAELLFSWYDVEGKTLHIYPDDYLTKAAYETIREELDA